MARQGHKVIAIQGDGVFIIFLFLLSVFYRRILCHWREEWHWRRVELGGATEQNGECMASGAEHADGRCPLCGSGVGVTPKNDLNE